MSSWKTVALGEIAESIDYGITASSSQRPIGPKFLRITDIQNGSVNWDTVPWCNCDAQSAADAQLKLGDIVFARTGATTGKSFLIRKCPSNTVFASYLIRVRVSSNAEPRFVSHFFHTPMYWAQIFKSARGVAQPGVNATVLKRLEIPLPPIFEQRRIAEVLDHADALRAKRRATLVHLDSLAQSIFVDFFGDPTANTKRWPKVQLQQVCDNITDGTHDTPVRVGSGVPFLTSKNIRPFEFDLSELDFVSPETHQEIIKRCNPRSGDVLYTNIGVNVGNAVVNRLSFEFSLKNVALIQPDFERLDSSFLESLLNFGPFKESILKVSSIGGAQKFVSLRVLRNVTIVLPPAGLQREFAVCIRTLENLRATQRASLAELDSLFASLQGRAFNGQL